MSSGRDDGSAVGNESELRSHDDTTQAFFDHSTAKRINTDTLIAKTLATQYPNLELIIVPLGNNNLLAYAAAGFATFEAVEETDNALPTPLSWTMYRPPARRIDGNVGALGEKLNFGKFIYRWKGEEFILYVVDTRDGDMYYSAAINQYLLTTERQKADALLLEAGRWAFELHGEIFVFDQGYWQKNAELYQSIMKASWENVILDADMKESIIQDHLSFFDSRDTYQRLQVPWKRGIIYHGPPGNGKTISIKAMMHTLYTRKEPIPTLYVRSLTSYSGPEFSLRMIFQKAREFAPCYLVFEDLDSIVSDKVRSYFLNEVDGLKNNDGIFMVGSTNHLDRLDPGISKRPSRFDRKYYFPDPNLEQRTAYCKFWQSKLSDNEDIDFPDKLCTAIAEITDKFSFAYMQEAFVAALLAIARRTKGSSGSRRHSEEASTRDMGDGWLGICAVGEGNDLMELVLWVEIKKQVEILREGMETKKGVELVELFDIDQTYKDFEL
ncbi:ATPase [Biscogniauxia marginata]|nr:ATPase [Biscogniauxia marginata]